MNSEFEERDVVIDKILSRLLEDFARWKTVELMPGIGPQFPLVHPDFSTRLDGFRTQVRCTLENVLIVSDVSACGSK